MGQRSLNNSSFKNYIGLYKQLYPSISNNKWIDKINNGQKATGYFFKIRVILIRQLFIGGKTVIEYFPKCGDPII
jgi:hypothetical protein